MAPDTCREPEPERVRLDIPTTEGTMTARRGDRIVRDDLGFHPVKLDVFRGTHEGVAETDG